jgi:hypothetical protein
MTDATDGRNSEIPDTTNGADGVNPDGLDSSQVFYTETVVSKNPDGTTEVRTRQISLADEIAENALREAIAAGAPVRNTMGYDSGCAGTSNWLYDQTGLTGNRICFNFPAYQCDRNNLNLYARGPTFSCNGRTYQPLWAGGPKFCDPFSGGASWALPDSNEVRSLWTGYPQTSGIAFYTKYGVFNSQYTGANQQYSNVTPYGRDVQTCGQPLN